jgi:hypothetical protein
MSIGLDSLTNSGGMQGGDATATAGNDGGFNTVNFSKTFGSNGFVIPWWVWLAVGIGAVWYLWKKK